MSSATWTTRVRFGFLLTLAAAACGPRSEGEDPGTWWDPPAGLEVTEPLVFTEDPYDFPTDADQGIGALREDAIDSSRDNDGPRIASEDWSEALEGCQFWEEADDLPRVVEGIVTSYPRVYRKIEGCGGDERYYGSYHLQDGTGAIFVLRDSKVAAFDIGAKVKLEVRGVRRRYGVDMIYVARQLEVDTGPYPVSFETRSRPLTEADQSRVVRVRGTVVTEPTTFGEQLIQIEGWEGTCAPDDENTRAECLVVQMDQELGRRGVALPVGSYVQLTAPVVSATYFAPAGIFPFYGLYLTRVGQIDRLDAVDGD